MVGTRAEPQHHVCFEPGSPLELVDVIQFQVIHFVQPESTPQGVDGLIDKVYQLLMPSLSTVPQGTSDRLAA